MPIILYWFKIIDLKLYLEPKAHAWYYIRVEQRKKSMLNDTLQALYTAIKENNQNDYKNLLNGLNRMGMDTYTVKVLIKELLKEGIIN